MKLFIIFLIPAYVAYARTHYSSPSENDIDNFLKGKFQIFGYHEFSQNELCRNLRCKRNEVCIVNKGDAMCIKKRKLFEMSSDKLPNWLQNEKKAHQADQSEHFTRVKHVEDMHEKHQVGDKAYFTKETKKAEAHAKHVHGHSRHMKDKVDTSCTDKQLDAIGYRLKIWFANIHRHEPNTVVHVARHTISCPREVGWMFGKLDGDSDGSLTPDELDSMESDPYEHCLRPFMDRCDTDADEEIDMDEWCDCFLFSGKEREEPPCHKVVHKTDPHLLGAFHPRCDIEGYYKPVQCHERHCWCVDRLGREFDRSRVIDARPDCGQYEIDDDESDLQYKKIPKPHRNL